MTLFVLFTFSEVIRRHFHKICGKAAVFKQDKACQNSDFRFYQAHLLPFMFTLSQIKVPMHKRCYFVVEKLVFKMASQFYFFPDLNK